MEQKMWSTVESIKRNKILKGRVEKTNNRSKTSNRLTQEKKESFQRLSPTHLGQALQLLKHGLPLKGKSKFDQYQCLNNSEKMANGTIRPPNDTPVVLESLRCALLQHRWSDVASLLPQLFNAPYCKQILWKTALQVFCYHPESSPEKLEKFLRYCFQQKVSNDLIDSILCTPNYTCSLSEGVESDDGACGVHFLASDAV